jgi:dTDP-4-dehydrorhamnose 3,5-epimerase
MTDRDRPSIAGLQHLHSQRHPDERGWFLEILRETVLGDRFVQANHSHSRAGVLRGLHYHRRQADAWYVVSGRARVGLADLRTTGEPTVMTVELAADDPAVLYIPPGVAHGFLAVTDLDLIYLVTQYYDASDEFGVAWNDPTLAVPWLAPDPILSDRDREAPRLDWSQVSSILGDPTPRDQAMT